MSQACRLRWALSKAWKDELIQDLSVRNLAESLRELVCAANECSDIPVIKGTEDVIDAIGRVSLEIASFIDEYARLRLPGEPIVQYFASLSSSPTFCQVRTVRDALSGDMKTRLESFQARCQNLMAKLGNHLNIDANKIVRQLKDGNLGAKLFSARS